MVSLTKDLQNNANALNNSWITGLGNFGKEVKSAGNGKYCLFKKTRNVCPCLCFEPPGMNGERHQFGVAKRNNLNKNLRNSPPQTEMHCYNF